MLASFDGDVWAGSIRPAASTAFAYQPVVPRDVGSEQAFFRLSTGSDRPSTSASHCSIWRVAARILRLEIGRFMGHAKVTTTLRIYAHLFEDNHTEAMAALGPWRPGPSLSTAAM